MKSPGIIYRRYRQLKKKYLYEKIQEARRSSFNNCIYGRPVTYKDENGNEHAVKLCIFSALRARSWQDSIPNPFDICTNPRECNAFAQKWTKESVIDLFNKEMSNFLVKQHLYPDLTVMEWLLDKQLTDAEKEPNFIGKILICLINVLENLLKAVNEPKNSLIENKKD